MSQTIARACKRQFSLASMAAALLVCGSSVAQRTADIDFVSVGRGAALAPAIPTPLHTEPEHLEDYPRGAFEDYPEQYWLVGSQRNRTLPNIKP